MNSLNSLIILIQWTENHMTNYISFYHLSKCFHLFIIKVVIGNTLKLNSDYLYLLIIWKYN